MDWLSSPLYYYRSFCAQLTTSVSRFRWEVYHSFNASAQFHLSSGDPIFATSRLSLSSDVGLRHPAVIAQGLRQQYFGDPQLTLIAKRRNASRIHDAGSCPVRSTVSTRLMPWPVRDYKFPSALCLLLRKSIQFLPFPIQRLLVSISTSVRRLILLMHAVSSVGLDHQDCHRIWIKHALI